MRVFFLLVIFLFSSLQAITIKGRIINGTTESSGSAETLKILNLRQGMQVIQEKKNVSGSFSFQNITGEAPFMLQATRQGVTYNQIVPPNKLNEIHNITVYDSTSSAKDIKIRSLVHFVREKDQMLVFKLYMITNASLPPRTWSPDTPFEIYIPENAVSLNAGLNQGSGMTIPLNPEKGREGYRINRSILPGSSSLELSYILPAEDEADLVVEDKILFGNNDERILFLKPADMKVVIDGTERYEEVPNAPQGLKGYNMLYKTGGTVSFALSGGTPVASTTKKRVLTNGDIFYDNIRSVIGLLAFVGLLFTFSFILSYREKQGGNAA